MDSLKLAQNFKRDLKEVCTAEINYLSEREAYHMLNGQLMGLSRCLGSVYCSNDLDREIYYSLSAMVDQCLAANCIDRVTL